MVFLYLVETILTKVLLDIIIKTVYSYIIVIVIVSLYLYRYRYITPQNFLHWNFEPFPPSPDVLILA
jgi:hypothetical protein